MKTYGLTIILVGALGVTGCRSVNKLSKDSAAVTTAPPKKNTKPAKREFLDHEVTPGGMVAKNSKDNHTKKNTAANMPAQTVNNRPDLPVAPFGMERTNMLQLKYAIAMDATVEKMNNIPLLETIDKWWGTKYCMGGKTDSCIDCSAFTQVLMKDVYKVTLPRTSMEQYNYCEKIELEDLHEGDLVFFNTEGRSISHVGVYLMNNKFVHASTSGGVMISDLTEKYWQPRIKGAGRAITGGSK